MSEIPLISEEEIMTEDERIRRNEERIKKETYEEEGWNKYTRPKSIVPKDECCRKMCHTLNEYINFMEIDEKRKKEEFTHIALAGSPLFKPRREHKKIAYGIDSLDKFREHLKKTKVCKCIE